MLLCCEYIENMLKLNNFFSLLLYDLYFAVYWAYNFEANNIIIISVAVWMEKNPWYEQKYAYQTHASFASDFIWKNLYIFWGCCCCSCWYCLMFYYNLCRLHTKDTWILIERRVFSTFWRVFNDGGADRFGCNIKLHIIFNNDLMTIINLMQSICEKKSIHT